MDPLVENLGKWVRIVFVMFTGRSKSWVIRLYFSKRHIGVLFQTKVGEVKTLGGFNHHDTPLLRLRGFSLGGVHHRLDRFRTLCDDEYYYRLLCGQCALGPWFVERPWTWRA